MKRKSGIELLRILLIVFVILGHYVNPKVGAGLTFAKNNIINHNYLLIIYCISICAVNIFVIISGYFLSMSQKRSVRKIIDLILQVIVVRELVYIGSALYFNQRISVK